MHYNLKEIKPTVTLRTKIYRFSESLFYIPKSQKKITKKIISNSNEIKSNRP